MIRKLLSYIRPYLPIAVFFVFWEILALLLGKDKLPRVEHIFVAFVESINDDPIIKAQGGDDGFLPHVIITAVIFATGFVTGSITGVSVAILIIKNKILRLILEPLLEIFRVIPPLILVPFVFLFSDPSNLKTSIFITSLYTAFPICIYSLTGFENIKKNHLFLAYFLGATSWQRLRSVELPAIMPQLVGALRITAPITLGILVVTEYLGSPEGIGRVLKFAISYTNLDLIFVGIVWIVIIALITDRVILLSFNHILRWTERTRDQ